MGAILDCIEIHVGAHLIEQAVDAARRQGLIRGEDLKLIEQRLGRPLRKPA
jgi:hypothetical protein